MHPSPFQDTVPFVVDVESGVACEIAQVLGQVRLVINQTVLFGDNPFGLGACIQRDFNFEKIYVKWQGAFKNFF